MKMCDTSTSTRGDWHTARIYLGGGMALAGCSSAAATSALPAASALAALAASALRMASRRPSTMKRLVTVSSDSAVPCSQSTLASAVS